MVTERISAAEQCVQRAAWSRKRASIGGNGGPLSERSKRGFDGYTVGILRRTRDGEWCAGLVDSRKKETRENQKKTAVGIVPGRSDKERKHGLTRSYNLTLRDCLTSEDTKRTRGEKYAEEQTKRGWREANETRSVLRRSNYEKPAAVTKVTNADWGGGGWWVVVRRVSGFS